MNKKKLCFVSAAVMAISLILSGCGRQEEPQSIQDIRAETEQLSNGADKVDTSEMLNYEHLGSQFWKGERIQLWGERQFEGCRLYLHREDGSRELLAEGVDKFQLDGRWWIDGDKRCYILKSDGIMRIGSDGSVTFDNETGKNVNSICQLEDGRLIVLTWGERSQVLAELDPDTGAMKEYQDIQLSLSGQPMIAAEENNALLLDAKGVWEVTLAQKTVGSRISFEGTSYTLKADEWGKREKQDFRLNESGEIELLWSDGTAEFLRQEQVSDEKEILVFRAGAPSTWLKEQVVKFNQDNPDYYVTLEEAEDEEWNSFRERTDLDLGVGKGGDIICSMSVKEVYSLLEKGVFEDLTPYMEKSGIQEENYFPAAFSGWKYNGGIYGLASWINMEGLWIKQEVIGETELSDLEDLTDRLLGYEGDAVFLKYTAASDLLKLLLKDSENLGGMVDLENGTCDFGGELFEKLLKTAERYKYDETKASMGTVAGKMHYNNFYDFVGRSFLEEQGKAPLGYWFGDGWHAEANNEILAINSSSSKKEGAWEFLRFLLGSEAQSDFLADESNYMKATYFPVDKNAFDALCKKHSEEINGGYDVKVLSGEGELLNLATGLTEERKTELKRVLEEAGTTPFRTGPLLQIILEEAEGYFSGIRGIDDVRTMVENRIQLYLNEQQKSLE